MSAFLILFFPLFLSAQQQTRMTSPQKVTTNEDKYENLKNNERIKKPQAKASTNSTTAPPFIQNRQVKKAVHLRQIKATPNQDNTLSAGKLVAGLEQKLYYLKNLPQTDELLVEIATTEQQLFQAYQRLSYEQECVRPSAEISK